MRPPSFLALASAGEDGLHVDIEYEDIDALLVQ